MWADGGGRADLGHFEKLGTWTPPAPWQARGAFPFGVAVHTPTEVVTLRALHYTL